MSNKTYTDASAQELIKKHTDYIELRNWETKTSVCWDGTQWQVQREELGRIKVLHNSQDFQSAFGYLVPE